MKVVCNNIKNGDGDLKHMTINKTYNVLSVDNGKYGNIGYSIKNDIGSIQTYSKKRFTPISDIREETLNKILEC